MKLSYVLSLDVNVALSVINLVYGHTSVESEPEQLIIARLALGFTCQRSVRGSTKAVYRLTMTYLL